MSTYSIESIRLTAAEILAAAVAELFPMIQCVAVQLSGEGFFCDFATEQPLESQALPLIEEKMRGIIKADLAVEQREMMRENAAEFFKHRGLPLKAEQVLESDWPTVAVVHIGKFCDFIPWQEEAGPQPVLAETTVACRAFKVLEIGPAFREGEQPVVRVKGTACADLPALKAWVKRIKVAKKRDHRVLGSHLGLFQSGDALCSGSWIWLPKGMAVRDALLDFWKEEVEREGFRRVSTPGLQDDESMPSRALAHAYLFSEGQFQGRDLPIRYAECAERFLPIPYEKLEGMLQSRLSLSDALHLFCTPEQALAICISSLQFFVKTIKIFTFEPRWVLVDSRPSHTPLKHAEWREAVQLLSQAGKGAGIALERAVEPADRQGPRLEMRLGDALGHPWAVATLGVDGLHPRLLDLHYRDGAKKQTPVMLTGALFGSLERLVALLIENEKELNILRRREAV